MTYAEKLKDPRWQKKRLHVMEAAKWSCQLCGEETKQLHVHHPKYDARKEPWEYDNLICLCSVCHDRHHAVSKPFVDPFWHIVTRDARKGDARAHQLLAMRDAGTLKAV